jgi:hypothetical protein
VCCCCCVPACCPEWICSCGRRVSFGIFGMLNLKCPLLTWTSLFGWWISQNSIMLMLLSWNWF